MQTTIKRASQQEVDQAISGLLARGWVMVGRGKSPGRTGKYWATLKHDSMTPNKSTWNNS